MGKREDIETTRLSLDEIMTPTWSTVVALLERVSPKGSFALRLGLIEQLHRVLDELAHEHSKADGITEARALIEALAHMPYV